jgi:hypothetical protein
MKTRRETAIGEQLSEKGFMARNLEFQIAIARFAKSGGEYGVGLAIYNAAFGRGSEDRIVSSRIDGETGHIKVANGPMPQCRVSSSPQRNGEGSATSPPISSRHKPGHARCGAAEIGSVQSTLAKSLWDTTLLPDGRRLREVRWSECPALSSRYRHLSRVLMAIHASGTPAHPEDTLDTIVNDDGLREIVAAVEKFNDIQ